MPVPRSGVIIQGGFPAAPQPAVAPGEPTVVDAAFASGAIRIVHQPIVDLADGRVVGVEALSRFAILPRRSPDMWFDAAAEAGRRVELELLALELALDGLPRIPDDRFLSVNASPETVVSTHFAGQLRGAPLERVVVELTGQTLVVASEALAGALRPLRAEGLRVAVDDLGSGAGSLSRLVGVRPDQIKLDPALTTLVDRDRGARALAAALGAFALETGAVLVAEGVESASQSAVLQAVGVALGQGFLFGEPA